MNKKILSLILSAVMLFGIMSTAAYAENAESGKRYKNYTVLGDSIATAYGTAAYEKNLAENYPGELIRDGHIIPGSYVQIVGDEIAENTFMDAHSGWRITEFLRMLEYPGFEYDNDAYSKYYKSNFFLYALEFLDKEDLDASSLKSDIKAADVITFNYGSNDIFTYALLVTWNKYSYIVDHSYILETESLDDLANAFTLMLQLADENQIRGILTEYINAVKTGVDMFIKNFPIAIEAIRSLNKDAEIYVIGLCNPVTINFPVDIEKALGFNFYDTSDMLVDLVNSYMNYKCPLADEYTYVDVVGTEYFGTKVFDWSSVFNFDLLGIEVTGVKMVHPTENGHAYMAEKILNAMAGNIPFKDVSEADYYYEGVRFCYNNRYMLGVTNTGFAPSMVLSRGQLAAILYRMAGSPDVSGLKEPFADVAPSYYAYDAIVWAYNEGVIKGVTPHSFMPAAYVSRGQAVTMLYRFAGSPETDGTLSYKDSGKISGEYRAAVAWASENGIVEGFDDNCFNCLLGLTRGQAAMIVKAYAPFIPAV